MQPENTREYRQIERYLRSYDPLATTEEGYDDSELAQNARIDIARVDGMLATDPTLTAKERNELYLMGGNLRLDWLYANSGGTMATLEDFNNQVAEANDFFIKGGKEAMQSHEQHPQRLWGLTIKHLDLLALSAFRNAQDSQDILKGTVQESTAWTLADNQMKSVLHRSVGLMRDMQHYAVGDTDMAQDTRGLLYETLLVGYARLQTYENESFDKVFVRSALDREDRPWNGHVYPKRSFDIVINEPQGNRLLQIKNYDNHDEYAVPIEKITAEKFAHTLHNLPRYTADFDLLIRNPSDPHLREQLNAAGRRLDQEFGSKLGALA